MYAGLVSRLSLSYPHILGMRLLFVYHMQHHMFMASVNATDFTVIGIIVFVFCVHFLNFQRATSRRSHVNVFSGGVRRWKESSGRHLSSMCGSVKECTCICSVCSAIRVT